MTVRKQWLLVLIVVAVLSVLISAVILSSLTDRSFQGYLTTRYENNIDELKVYLTGVYQNDQLNDKQIAAEISAYLDDPILAINIYDTDGTLLYVTRSSFYWRNGMPGGMMGMHDEKQSQETDTFDVVVNGETVMIIQIVRYSAVGNSLAVTTLKRALLLNSLIAGIIVVVLALIIGTWVSKKTSSDLIQTADYAQKVDMGEDVAITFSNVKEVGIIQHSLVNLRNRLKLKQKSRKTLIDELVHQTRTPLTILRSHLEGFQDGIIEMTPEQIAICETQVENITAIISNMSGLIDAGREQDVVTAESFELPALSKKIAGGLRAQMDQKGISFSVDSIEAVSLHTDRYKLSQAIYNLLTNACKYTPQGGNVKISAFVDGEQVAITISDNGVGIRQEDHQKIFDAYFRSDYGNTVSGEGLGLYVAMQNITAIGGTLHVESKPGLGSTFRIQIPKNFES